MATGSLSSVPNGLRMVEAFSCTRCLEQNLTESADIYCEICLRFWCKKCVILHSHFFTKHMTCGREDIKKWPVSKAVEDFLRKCEVHEDETLTQFCHDHSQLCCSACVGTIHRGLILTSSCPKNNVPKLQHSHYISTGHVDGEGSLPRKPHRANEQCHCAKRDPSEKKDSGPYITLGPIQAPTAAIQPEPCELRGRGHEAHGLVTLPGLLEVAVEKKLVLLGAAGGLPLQQPSQIIVWWHSASDVAQLGLHVQCILATAATVGSAVYNVWTTTFLQQFITTPSSVVGQHALSRAHLALRAVAVTLFSSCPAPCVSLVYSTVSMAIKLATKSLTSTQYSLWGKG
ncbi:uncharacterized protein LOC127860448 isoform X3 [Dreissena polymorpha]|uniref:uncharacterized protein LOC127860448 isoform X3 n=1 Tax=Dreissena polymorpha TaxID=45954 RepID=UPI00226463AD|nr:uncharacterized protein LOC127860448 isoform X3 [Dreissena polymorpha]